MARPTGLVVADRTGESFLDVDTPEDLRALERIASERDALERIALGRTDPSASAPEG